MTSQSQLGEDIVRRLARMDPINPDEWYGCMFCAAGNQGEEFVDHETDCTWAQARRLTG